MKTSTSRLHFVLTMAFFAMLTALTAQDIHFSQFSNSPMNLSPGLTGVFGGDLRAVANYRNQWRSVPVPYTTFSASMEQKVYLLKSDKDADVRYGRYFTGGLLINYDRQGSLRLTSLQIAIPLSFTYQVGEHKNHFVTLGAMPSFGQRAFSTNKLSTDAQWLESIYDPYADTRESLLFDQNSISYIDFDAGLNYRLQSAKGRSKLDVGGAMHHINRPYHDFWSSTIPDAGNVRLQSKTTFYATALLQLAERFDLVGQGLYQRQGGYREIVYGGGLKFHLDQRRYHEFAIQIGVNYRSRYRDAIIPQIELGYKAWTLGVSWDRNPFADVKLITNRNAGPEVSLIYRHYRVKPLASFKSCPVI